MSEEATILSQPGSLTPRGKDTQDTEKQASKREAPSAPPDFPEGGLQGWATVVGAFLIQFCGFGYSTSFGVYQDFYVQRFLTDETSSTISWIGSVNSFLIIAGGLVAGRLYDRGYFYPLIYGGAFLIAFGLFMLSLAKPNHFYQVFLSQGLCVGLGGGIIYVPSVAIVSHYFRKRRALAMSLVASGSSFGAVIHPIMLNNTLGSHLGFGNAVRASAGLVTGSLLISCMLMRTRLPPPDNMVPFIPAVKKFSHDWAYICATLGLTVFTMGFYFPFFYLQLDAANHNLGQTFSFYALVIMNFCSFVGRFGSGFLAQIVGVPNMIVIATGACAAVIVGMLGLKSVASVVLIGIFFGLFAGAYIALIAPLMAVLTDDFHELGLKMGVAFAISAVGGLIGSPINGALLTAHFVWWRPATFSAVMAFCGFACFAAMRLILHQRKRRTTHNFVKA